MFNTKIIKSMVACVAMTMAVLLPSCNSEGVSEATSFMSFVTIEGVSDYGTVFTTRQNGDSPLVTFTSGTVLKADQYPLGSRWIIGYTNEANERYKSGPIALTAIIPVFNGKIEKATAEEIKKLTNNDLTPSLIQREGQWLNLECSATVAGQPKKFALLVDESTLDNEYPDVYIGFETDTNSGPVRQFYASFDLTSVWMLPTCNGIKVHYKLYGTDRDHLFQKGVQ